MKFVRALLDFLIPGAASDRYYKAFGRPDESLKGKIFQHYGFRSAPPEGVEMFHIESGNNGYSVAENDGNLSDKSGTLEDGDMVIYTKTGNYIRCNASGNVVIVTQKNNTSYSFEINGDQIKTGSPVSFKGASTVNTYYVVTEKFLTDFCAHVHLDPVSGISGTPQWPTGPLMTPILLNGDLAKTLKSD